MAGMEKNNIYIEKIWREQDLIELLIKADSEYVSARQTCYVSEDMLMESGQKLISYSWSNDEEMYYEFGEKEGNCTPAFSMRVMRIDRSGHFKIEMDMEIMDAEDRSHRCMFFVNAETTAIERLGRGLQAIAKDSGREWINLVE